MKKNLFIVIALLISVLCVKAQGTLQFNQVKIISNSLVTVPSGKVWKVTGIFGVDRMCVPCNTTDYSTHSACPSRYIDFTGSLFYLNGNEVVSYRSWNNKFVGSETIYSDAACTSGYDTYTAGNYKWKMFDVPVNSNILPMWLPALATVRTGTANMYLSVLEFNIIP